MPDRLQDIIALLTLGLAALLGVFSADGNLADLFMSLLALF
ncbi:MAG TPA: hypothetical protein VL133_01445 [Devosia sp.]|nr:hypothetical protein [Devosia sp.]